MKIEDSSHNNLVRIDLAESGYIVTRVNVSDFNINATEAISDSPKLNDVAYCCFNFGDT